MLPKTEKQTVVKGLTFLFIFCQSVQFHKLLMAPNSGLKQKHVAEGVEFKKYCFEFFYCLLGKQEKQKGKALTENPPRLYLKCEDILSEII